MKLQRLQTNLPENSADYNVHFLMLLFLNTHKSNVDLQHIRIRNVLQINRLTKWMVHRFISVDSIVRAGVLSLLQQS